MLGKKCFQLRNLIVLKYVARASGNGSFFNRKKERNHSPFGNSQIHVITHTSPKRITT